MNQEEYNQWLSSLKVGDKIAVKRSSYDEQTVIFTEIIKTTPKSAIRVKGYESRLFKQGAADTGCKWRRTYYKLEPINSELTQKETRKIKVYNIRQYDNYDLLDDNTINKIYELMYPHKAKTE